MKNEIKEKFMYSIECKTKVVNDEKIIGQVEEVCNALIKCYKEGHRVYMMGNGGSAADAQHFSAELVGRYMLERKGLPAVAFTTDTSILTAVGNDYGYDDVFRRQTEALVEKILKKSQENNNEEEKKPGHLPQTFRDIRIFSNTIRKAVDLMKQSGVNAVTKRRESEEYIEYTIKIPK